MKVGLLTSFDIWCNFPFLRRRLRPLATGILIEETASLLNWLWWSRSLRHLAWCGSWSMTSLKGPSMQTKLIGPLVHSHVPCGSDWASCFEVLVAWPLLESDMVPALICHLILPSANDAHLKRTTWGSSCAPSHCGAEAPHCCSSAIWINLFAWANKVVDFWRILGRSLSWVKGAILRERTNQVVTFDQRTLASLRFWLWNLRAILRRHLSCDSMGCSHCHPDTTTLSL